MYIEEYPRPMQGMDVDMERIIMIGTAVDLFCGIGGLTKGLSLAGIDVAAGFDVDESCRFAYEKNNNSDFICEDIVNVEPEEIWPSRTESGNFTSGRGYPTVIFRGLYFCG